MSIKNLGIIQIDWSWHFVDQPMRTVVVGRLLIVCCQAIKNVENEWISQSKQFNWNWHRFLWTNQLIIAQEWVLDRFFMSRGREQIRHELILDYFCWLVLFWSRVNVVLCPFCFFVFFLLVRCSVGRVLSWFYHNWEILFTERFQKIVLEKTIS